MVLRVVSLIGQLINYGEMQMTLKSEPYWVPAAKKAMRAKGITQNELQDVFEVGTRGAVGHYFTGRQIINVEQLKALSLYLGVHLDYCEPDSVVKAISLDDFSKYLDKWLVKFKQLRMVEYHSDIEQLKGLIMSDVMEDLSVTGEEEVEKYIKIGQ